ncbi:MAG: NusG domain II-containing protein [Sulfuriferula sp.]|nr:NusG domain II-containing protein [Sulfuriferula sp.]
MWDKLRDNIKFIQLGDGLILLISLGLVVSLTAHYWLAPAGEKIIIKRGGELFLTASLMHPFTVAIPGPLGLTQVEVYHQRARVVSDPSPRQLCVHQGWISRAGEVAICLPNQVSIEIAGTTRHYDSLNY